MGERERHGRAGPAGFTPQVAAQWEHLGMTADVTPVPEAPAPELAAPTGRPMVRRLVAFLIVASWIAWAVPAWRSTFHEVRAQELVSDLQANRVTGFLAVENVRQPSAGPRVGIDTSWLWGFEPLYDVPAADVNGLPEDGPPFQVLYAVDGGRTRWLPDTFIDGPDPFAALQASGVRPFTPATAPPSGDWAAYSGLLMALLVIGSLVAWPPRRGTRPFWVLVATVFAGFGVLAYAVRELVIGAPSSEGSRLRWPHGLLIAVVGGLFLPPLLGLLR